MMDVLIHLMLRRLQIFRFIMGGEGCVRCTRNGMGSMGGMGGLGIILVMSMKLRLGRRGVWMVVLVLGRVKLVRLGCRQYQVVNGTGAG